METITVERTIAAPIGQVFDWCATTTNYERSRWVLRDRLAEPGRDAPWGEGAIRVHTWFIGHFHERITRYDAPHSFGYVVDRSFPLARHEGGTMTFTEVPEGTRVTWVTTTEMAVPFAAATATRLIARPLVSHVFGRILRACADDLSSRSPRPTSA
ncbi:SRPBCC family protein [Nocardia sp. SYP-A9097]|uniref:SRPBCC family protein n=1 Tax=Nocardia sp. SYP-A9097 TaxID=2663237 RepID=UPI00129A3834|nr:SRPBCC family protein [Nocardia sp. SYP-A9097]MRH93496.1 SRPBCC family protein [Nocardia sp. SYP-A9097]